ncbi:carbohydrate binding family 9 domain-containing protein [Dyadobacter sp. CY107]|uniref:DUF5916 domain-containing protein n=1 Tax=Dyadobacter fanqingshengii TaxID=2906443 RepID=UPI001F2FBB97|nr:DUF5916 domain-containing protein [Dyadobacter fanqingshengii]MCF2502094.1 carbohydrate binding family 9 domain-containing protein [Dyadobacter fanqingshengii]
MTYKVFLVYLLLGVYQVSLAQDGLLVKRTTGPIKIDGHLDDSNWQAASMANNFKLVFLSDSGSARARTEVRVLRDERFLYIGAELYSADSGGTKKVVVSSLKRDFPFFENDLFGVVVNPSNDKLNGYAFNVNAAGVQEESQIFNGDSFDITWDQKWFAEVHQQQQKWTVEIAIPFKSLRFKSGQDQWSINFVRIDNRINEYSSWVFTPRNLGIGHMAYTRPLLWESSPTASGNQHALIPSLTSAFQQNYGNEKKMDFKVTPSLDAKISVTSSLALDLTANPDFSQVEVDAAQANLTRFELYFPERRQFFIENNDLFTDFGSDDFFSSPSRPFYTRRIGLALNPVNGSYEQVRILAGARLSGRAGKNQRIGLMSVQTASQTIASSSEEAEQFVPGQNYTVGVYQQRVHGRSNVTGIFVNRQAFGNAADQRFRVANKDYNRVAGLDYNLLSTDGKWYGKIFHHSSFTGGVKRNGYEAKQNSHGSFFRYTSRNFQAFAGHTFVGRDYNPETGFAPRTDFLNFRSSLRYYIYPKRQNGRINNFSPTIYYSAYLDPNNHQTDRTVMLANTLRFRNRSSIQLSLYDEWIRLLADFDPSRSGAAPLKAGTYYHYRYLETAYQSDNTKSLFYSLNINTGGYFNGQRHSVSGNINYKVQPWGIFSVNYRYTYLKLPHPQVNNRIWVFGPRADISFSRSLFLTTLVQYNGLSSNVNFFAKLQWRYRPLSDLFIVYQDNHNSKDDLIKTRSAAVKLVYWF